MRTALSDELGVDLALFAFNYQPDVVIEVCKAGGLGVLGAVRFTPQELKEALDYIEANIGGRPYGVDVVMPAKTLAQAGMEVGEMHEMLEGMIPQLWRPLGITRASDLSSRFRARKRRRSRKPGPETSWPSRRSTTSKLASGSLPGKRPRRSTSTIPPVIAQSPSSPRTARMT